MNALRVTRLAAVLLLLLSACEGTPPPSADPAAGPAANAEPSEEEFLNAYRAAHESRDVEAAMQLVYLEGVSEQLRTGLRRAFRTDFERGIASAELVDLTTPPLGEQTIDGVTYRASLEPVKELNVEFVRLNTADGEISGRTYPVGVANGRYYISSTIVSDAR